MKKRKIVKVKRIAIELSNALIQVSSEADEQFCDRVQRELKRLPDDLDLQMQYIDCLLNLKRNKEAIEVCNRILESQPQSDYIKFLLVDTYHREGYKAVAYRMLLEISDDEVKQTYDVDGIIARLKANMPYLCNSSQKDYVLDAYPIVVPFGKEPLPETYQLGKKKYIDPVRQKGIIITPEETVRQQVVSYLLKNGCPIEHMLVEESMAHIDRELRDRVDILVKCPDGDKMQALLLVECKAPGLPLDGEATRQILRYNRIIGAAFILLTDGAVSHVYYFDKVKGGYEPLRNLPTYKEMCDKSNITPVSLPKVQWERPSFESLSDPKACEIHWQYVGEDTPSKLTSGILNIAFCLLDNSENNRIECPLVVHGCTITKDYGVIPTVVGNAGAGRYEGNYRWLGVENRHGERRNVYLAVFPVKAQWTYFIIGVEEQGKQAIVSRLQVNLNKHLKSHSNGYRLTHNGQRSGKTIEPLIEHISQTVPELLGTSERIDLGWLDNSKALCLQDIDTAKVIGNAISYALLRSELSEAESKLKGKAKK